MYIFIFDLIMLKHKNINRQSKLILTLTFKFFLFDQIMLKHKNIKQ